MAEEKLGRKIDSLRHLANPSGDALQSELPEIIEKIRARTPARLFDGRAGTSYRTQTQMELREAHAAAKDAVRAELDLEDIFDSTKIDQWGLFVVSTRAASKDEYLARPDLGREFAANSAEEIARRCPARPGVQIVIGDGLSVAALRAQVPQLLPLLWEGAASRGWRVGQIFLVRYSRVGILNAIGDLLKPDVAILLIGERPGLATAESLSAYMAYRPQTGHTDAQRNLISNIHARGVDSQAAATRILNLTARMLALRMSGVTLREQPLELHEI
jgi:ethanolamine ammonia-lyase small subunit